MPRLLFLVACLSIGLLLCLPASGAQAARYTPANLADLVEKLMPAVVNISTTQTQRASVIPFGMMTPDMIPPGSPFEQFRDLLQQMQPYSDQLQVERKAKSLGSGFLISADGYIVTNNHVVGKADEILVTLSDNTEHAATLIGTDPKTDIALLKIEANASLPFVEFGDSDATRVGDWVVVIGNPFGLGGTVTTGIISARARDINAGPFDDFLQTDAAINSGNSGGPMFDLDGRVIGISTAIFTPTGGNVGIGFATPASLAAPVVKQLKNFGHAKRAWLGVKVQEVSKEIAESLGLTSTDGVLVVEVTPDSPADLAGMQSGDIITRFNGKPVGEFRRFPRLVAESPMGRPLSMQVLRQGQAQELAITLTESEESQQVAALAQPKPKRLPKAQASAINLLGMQLVPLPEAQAQAMGIEGGLMVAQVQQGSEAWQRGLRKGDILTRLNEETITSAEQLAGLLRDARQEQRQFVLLRIQRGQATHFVTLPTA